MADAHSPDEPHSFDDRAATWDTPDKIERARVLAEAIMDAVGPTGETTVLECGAGTGLVSQYFPAPIGALTLADTSSGMRRVAEQKVADGDLPRGTRVIDFDLERSDPLEATFDLIFMSMTLHHVHDLDRALATVIGMLAPGGHLAVIDLEDEDGSFHDDPPVDVHHGFDPDRLAERLTDAGLRSTIRRGVHDVVKNDRAYPLFMVVGRAGVMRRSSAPAIA